MRRRVAVTGVGAVTAAGCGRRLWSRLRAGDSGLRATEHLAAAGAITDFEAADHLDKRIVLQTDRHTQLGLVAADLALEDARLRVETVDRDRVGVVLANNLGGSAFGEPELVNLHTKGARAVSAYMSIAWFYAATIGQVSIKHGLKGYAKTQAGERAGGLIALGDALRQVQHGSLDVCLAGGCEAPLSPYALVGYADSGLLSPSGCYRPFDHRRDGLVIGEGAAVLVFEEWQHAERRGATILAEVRGFGHTCDAVHHRDGAMDGATYARAIDAALRTSDTDPQTVGPVFVDAAAGRDLDVREARAVRTAFGAATSALQVTSPKGGLGHTFGAAGALDAAIACWTLRDRCVPPLLGTLEVDPMCELPCLVGTASPMRGSAAVVTATGRGGINAALVLAPAS